MNDELLKKVYDKLGLQSSGTYDQFKQDISVSPELVQKVYDKLGLSSSGTIDQFKQDLGLNSNKGYNNDQFVDYRRAFLDTIAEHESPSYDTIVGGGKFNDFSKHPNVVGVITKDGPSTAAGLYQITNSTWKGIQKNLNLPDFSPESQDQAAWWLAQDDYHNKTGRNLDDDLTSQDPVLIGKIRNVLAPTWTSLKLENNDSFVNRYASMYAKRRGSAQAPIGPDGQPVPEGQQQVDENGNPVQAQMPELNFKVNYEPGIDPLRVDNSRIAEIYEQSGGKATDIDKAVVERMQTAIGDNTYFVRIKDKSGKIKDLKYEDIANSSVLENTVNKVQQFTGMAVSGALQGFAALVGGAKDIVDKLEDPSKELIFDDFFKFQKNGLIKTLDDASKTHISSQDYSESYRKLLEEQKLYDEQNDWVNGSLAAMSKVFYSEYWTESGAETLGQVASFIVPGTIAGKISKGLGFIGKAGKLVGLGEKGINNLYKASDILVADSIMSMFESATEGKETYTDALAHFKEQGLSEEEANKRAAEYASQTTGENFGMLMATNLISLNALKGAYTPLADISGKLGRGLLRPVGRTLQGFASEGIQEVYQQGIQNVAKEAYTDKNTVYDPEKIGTLDNLTGFWKAGVKAYEGVLSADPEYLESGTAGGLLGSSHIALKSIFKDIPDYYKVEKPLAKNISASLANGFNDILVKDEDGKIKFEDGKPIIDSSKYISHLAALSEYNDLSALQKIAEDNNNGEAIQFLQAHKLSNVIHNHLTKTGNTDAIKNAITDSMTKEAYKASSLRDHITYDEFRTFKQEIIDSAENAHSKVYENPIYSKSTNAFKKAVYDNTVQQHLVKQEIENANSALDDLKDETKLSAQEKLEKERITNRLENLNKYKIALEQASKDIHNGIKRDQKTGKEPDPDKTDPKDVESGTTANQQSGSNTSQSTSNTSQSTSNTQQAGSNTTQNAGQQTNQQPQTQTGISDKFTNNPDPNKQAEFDRIKDELNSYTTRKEYEDFINNNKNDNDKVQLANEHLSARVSKQSSRKPLTTISDYDNRYGEETDLLMDHEDRSVGSHLKDIISSQPDFENEEMQMRSNPDYETKNPKLKGYQKYLRENPNGTLDEYTSSSIHFNNMEDAGDEALQESINRHNGKPIKVEKQDDDTEGAKGNTRLQNHNRVLDKLKNFKNENRPLSDVEEKVFRDKIDSHLVNDEISKEQHENLHKFVDTLKSYPNNKTEKAEKQTNSVIVESEKLIKELKSYKTFQEKLAYLNRIGILQPITINGNTVNAIGHAERTMVLIKIGNVNIPFYIRIGLDGEKNVPSGKWYSVFGIGEDRGWINKGSEKDMVEQYNVPIFQKIAKILDEGIGNVTVYKDKINVGDDFELLEYWRDKAVKEFNNQLNFDTKPIDTDKDRKIDSKSVYDHISSVINKVNKETDRLYKEYQDSIANKEEDTEETGKEEDTTQYESQSSFEVKTIPGSSLFFKKDDNSENGYTPYIKVIATLPNGGVKEQAIERAKWRSFNTSDLNNVKEGDVDIFGNPKGTSYEEKIDITTGFTEEQIIQAHNVLNTILKEGDIVYYEHTSYSNAYNTKLKTNKKEDFTAEQISISIVAYVNSNGQIVERNTPGSIKVIIGNVPGIFKSKDNKTKPPKDLLKIRQKAFKSFNENTESVIGKLKFKSSDKSFAYNKGKKRSITKEEIDKFNFDAVISPYEEDTPMWSSTIKPGPQIHDNTGYSVAFNEILTLGKTSLSKDEYGNIYLGVRTKANSGISYTKLDVDSLDNFSSFKKPLLEALSNVMEIDDFKEADKKLKELWKYDIIKIIPKRDIASTYDASRTYKEEKEFNPKGGIGPVIYLTENPTTKQRQLVLIYTSEQGKIKETYTYNSAKELVDALGKRRINIDHKHLKSSLLDNIENVKTDLQKPRTNSLFKTPYPDIFSSPNNVIFDIIDDIDDNNETDNNKGESNIITNTKTEDTGSNDRNISNRIKNRRNNNTPISFKVTDKGKTRTEKQNAELARKYIKDRFSEVGVMISDSSLELLRELHEIGDKKIWGAFNKGIALLSSDSGEKVGKHEAFHIVFNLFLTDSQKQSVLKELFDYVKKNNNEQFKDYTEEDLKLALDSRYSPKNSKYDSSDNIYERQGLRSMLEEIGATLMEEYSYKGFIPKSFSVKYPKLSEFLSKIIDFLFDKYQRIKPYLTNKTTLNDIFYQLDNNILGRDFNGRRRRKYKEIFKDNFLNTYESDPKFRINGLNTSQVKYHADFIADMIIPSILEEKGYGTNYSEFFKNNKNPKKILKEIYPQIKSVLQFEKNIDPNNLEYNAAIDQTLELMSDENINKFQRFISARINQLTGIGIEITKTKNSKGKEIEEDISDLEEGNANETENPASIESELSESDNTDEQLDDDIKIAIKNSAVALEKTITGRLREYLNTIAVIDINTGENKQNGPLQAVEYYNYTEVRNRLSDELSNSLDVKDMFKKLIKAGEKFPYMNVIAQHIFSSIVENPAVTITDPQGNTISKEYLKNLGTNGILNNEELLDQFVKNINNSKLFSEIWLKFGQLRTLNLIGTFPTGDGTFIVRNLTKDKVKEKTKNTLFNNYELNAINISLDPNENNLSDVYSQYGLFIPKEYLKTMGKTDVTNLVNAFSLLKQFIQENNTNPFISGKKGPNIKVTQAVEFIINKFIEYNPNMSSTSVLTIKNEKEYAVQISNFITRKIDVLNDIVKSAEEYEKVSETIFDKHIPLYKSAHYRNIDNKSNNKNSKKFIEIFYSIGSKNAGSSQGKQYIDYENRELISNAINIWAFHKKNNQKVTVVMAPIFSDATAQAFVKFDEDLDSRKIKQNLVETALAELERISYVEENQDNTNFNNNFKKNGKFFILQEYLNPHKEELMKLYNEYQTTQDDTKLNELRDRLRPIIDKNIDSEFKIFLRNLIEYGLLTETKSKEGPKYNISEYLSTDLSGSNIAVESELRNYFEKQFYYNTQMIAVFAGDPANYSPNVKGEIKGDAEENNAGVSISHLKRFKQVHSPKTLLPYFDENGDRITAKRTLYLKDIIVEDSEDIKQAIDAGILSKEEVEKRGLNNNNLTDGATYNHLFFTLAHLEAIGRIDKNERQILQNRYINGEPLFQKDDRFKIKSIEILKPFSYNLDIMNDGVSGKKRTVPMQEKNSEITLLPETAYVTENNNKIKVLFPENAPKLKDGSVDFSVYRSPELAKILYVLEGKGDIKSRIDSVSFDSTLKAFSPDNKIKSIDDINAKDIYDNVYPKDIDGYGEQQVVPGGKFKVKEKTQGSQPPPIFLNNATEEQTEVLTKSYKKDIDEELEKRKRETSTEIKIAEKLQNNAIKQSSHPNTIEAYDLWTDENGKEDGHINIPLSYGLQRKQNEAGMNALFKDIVMEKGPGATFVNSPGLGFQNNLNINFKKDGNGKITGIDSVDCAVTVYHPLIKRLTNEYGLVTVEQVEKAYGKEISDKLLTSIGYRIPTEGPYSIYKLKVKYFLPESAGAQIVLPRYATTITGLDFDVDKLFCKFYQFDYEYKAEDITEIKKVINEKIIDSYNKENFSDNKIEEVTEDEHVKELVNIALNKTDNYIDEQSGLSSSDIYIVKQLRSKENFSLIEKYVIKNIKYNNEESTKEGRQNKRMEIHEEIMSSERWMKQFLNPGSKAQLKDAVEKLRELKKEINGKKEKEYLASPNNQFHNASKANEGGRSIGKFANANKHFMFTNEIQLELKSGINFLGKRYKSIGGKISNPESQLEIAKNKEIFGICRTLSELLAASVDNIKEPYLEELNITGSNIDMLTAAVRLGFSIEHITKMLNIPGIMQTYKKNSSNSKTIIRDLIKLKNNIAEKHNIDLEDNEGDLIIREVEKEEQINNLIKANEIKTKEDAESTIAVIDTLIELHNVGDELIKLQSMTKFDTENSFSPSFINTLSKIRNIKNQFKDKAALESVFRNHTDILPNPDGFGPEYNNSPFAYIEQHFRVASNIISHFKKYFPHYSDKFEKITKKIEQLLELNSGNKEFNNSKTTNKIINELYNYIGQQIFSTSSQISTKKLIDDFPGHFSKALKILNSNPEYKPIFMYLTIQYSGRNSYVSKDNNIQMDANVVMNTQDAILKMLDDTTEIEKGYLAKDFANDLILYGQLKSGFSFTPLGYAELTPPDYITDPNISSYGYKLRKLFLDPEKYISNVSEEAVALSIIYNNPELAVKVNNSDIITDKEQQGLYHGFTIPLSFKIKHSYEDAPKYYTIKKDSNENLYSVPKRFLSYTSVYTEGFSQKDKLVILYEYDSESESYKPIPLNHNTSLFSDYSGENIAGTLDTPLKSEYNFPNDEIGFTPQNKITDQNEIIDQSDFESISDIWPDDFSPEEKKLQKEMVEKGTVTQQQSSVESITGFQGYKGGFEDKGKGTPEGDGKDKAMREVADYGIFEVASNKPSSTVTSARALNIIDQKGKTVLSGNLAKSANIVMLARNYELKNTPLEETTKFTIEDRDKEGAEFVVGDMPGVDSQFIDYLQEIGAKFTVYHTGNTPRIKISKPTTPTVTTEVKPGVEISSNAKGLDKKEISSQQKSTSVSKTEREITIFDASGKEIKERLDIDVFTNKLINLKDQSVVESDVLISKYLSAFNLDTSKSMKVNGKEFQFNKESNSWFIIC